jgi:hypothetical protein
MKVPSPRSLRKTRFSFFSAGRPASFLGKSFKAFPGAWALDLFFIVMTVESFIAALMKNFSRGSCDGRYHPLPDARVMFMAMRQKTAVVDSLTGGAFVAFIHR